MYLVHGFRKTKKKTHKNDFRAYLGLLLDVNDLPGGVMEIEDYGSGTSGL